MARRSGSSGGGGSSPGDVGADLAGDWHKVVKAGVVDRVGMIEGTAPMGRFPLVFSLAQVTAARELGVEVPSAVDAVLADPEARAEVTERLEQADYPVTA